MESIQCSMNKEKFQRHMSSKIEQWKPTESYIGEDFCVFHFLYPYKCIEAVNTLQHYASYYGYRYVTDNANKLVIVNIGGGYYDVG